MPDLIIELGTNYATFRDHSGNIVGRLPYNGDLAQEKRIIEYAWSVANHLKQKGY